MRKVFLSAGPFSFPFFSLSKFEAGERVRSSLRLGSRRIFEKRSQLFVLLPA